MSAENKPWLEQLNPAQKEAAEVVDGPVIVLAGAGSGKTKMLTTRVANLIHENVAPQSILAVTFTNKAAKEMKSRVQNIIAAMNLNMRMQWVEPWMGFSQTMPEVSTFHSFCVKLLRAESEAAGFTRPFVIYDDSDQLSLLKKIVKQMNLSGNLGNAKAYKAAINNAKTQAMTAGDLDVVGAQGPFQERLIEVYSIYQSVLRENQALDFGDIIVQAYYLLRDRPEILERYQERFRYIMVDEYQDTNRAQYLLISLLAKKYRNLCVVGDEDQSIYKWRGADIRNILDFKSEYQEAKMIKLEQNYRSTKTIIQAASHLIKNNRARNEKTLWTDNEKGDLIKIVNLSDERAEADFVVREVQAYLRRDESLSLNDIAIFYRSHAQSRALEEMLRRELIAYQIVGGLAFYDRKEIKDILAYMKVISNPDDSISLARIINVPARGIGKTTVEKLEQFAADQGCSLFRAITTVLTLGGVQLGSSALKKLDNFIQLLQGLIEESKENPISDIYQKFLERTGYLAELQAENSPESKVRIENMEELLNVMRSFEEEWKAKSLATDESMLVNFLNQICLESQVLVETESTSQGTVSMMTLHSSKGLEFDLVFMVGCEEGLFPTKHAVHDNADGTEIEEERRLCYVGMTRARKYLVMSAAAMRRIHGQLQVCARSRFLSEIDSKYCDLDDRTDRGSTTIAKKWESRRSSSSGTYYDSDGDFSSDIPIEDASGQELNIGLKVRHAEYGVGKICNFEGVESNRKVTIEFQGFVKKKFALKFVKLELES